MQITFNCFSLLYEKVAHTLVGIVNTSYLIQTIDFFFNINMYSLSTTRIFNFYSESSRLDISKNVREPGIYLLRPE